MNRQLVQLIKSVYLASWDFMYTFRLWYTTMYSTSAYLHKRLKKYSLMSYIRCSRKRVYIQCKPMKKEKLPQKVWKESVKNGRKKFSHMKNTRWFSFYNNLAQCKIIHLHKSCCMFDADDSNGNFGTGGKFWHLFSSSFSSAWRMTFFVLTTREKILVKKFSKLLKLKNYTENCTHI